jgi:hypothetical protein
MKCLTPGCPAPVRLCACQCGQAAPIASQTDARYGHVKSQPVRFIQGHHSLKHGHSRVGRRTKEYIAAINKRFPKRSRKTS